ELVIEVDRVEVAAEAGEVDDVGLRHGAARRQPLLTDLHVIEIQVLRGERHGCFPRPRQASSVFPKSTGTAGETARAYLAAGGRRRQVPGRSGTGRRSGLFESTPTYTTSASVTRSTWPERSAWTLT